MRETQFINQFPAKTQPHTSHNNRKKLAAMNALKGKAILKNHSILKQGVLS